ncbi:MAG TPA: ABC transporter permease [Solirubrobacteraceae bacterium]|nr:ABC transporter permease [Solirubrobacteraceae bacterium]
MSRYAGTGAMLRLAIRRERLRIPVYLVLFTLLVVETALQSQETYPTRAARAAYVATVEGNPGLIAMVGLPYDLTTVGGDVAWQLGGFGAAFVALMSMFIVGRHTRAEEQSGRSELVGAAPIGRSAPLTAALVVVAVAQALLGIAVALAMIGTGEPSAGSLALGASLTGVGLVFAGLAAVAAQLSQTTSAMYGMTGAAIGGAYLLRAAGDVGDGTLSWLSPIGWGQAMRPFAAERWWPLALSLAATAASVAGAVALRARRDEGAGLVTPRPGPASASPRLTSPLGLALRLQRGALLGWSAGLFVSGLSIGLTGRDAESLVGDSDQIGQILGSARGDIVDQYFAVSMLTMALIGAGFGVQVALRMRSEETSGRLEPLLAAAFSRGAWTAAYIAVAMAGSALVLAANGLGAGLADALNSHDAGQLPRLLAAAVAPAPAVWVVVGAAVALFGVVPRAAAAAWGVLGACVALSVLGPLLGLPEWVLGLSPFDHVPQLPAEDFTVAPLAWLCAIAAALTALGMVAFRRRDLAP